jgi:hypothetical protein
MKKIVVLVLLGFASFLLLAGNKTYAADDVVEVYPYGQIACLEGTSECTGTKVGSDHWNFTYAGYRYHAVRGSVRYVSEFTDDNLDGKFDLLEVSGISWGSFGSPVINNTDETAVLYAGDGAVLRSQVYSGSRHDVYMHFDEAGVLQMYEATVETFHITNVGTVEAPEWRLATQAEMDAFDAATDPATETPNTIKDNIRIKLDDTDEKGYVLERLQYTKLIADDVDPLTDPVSSWSSIIEGNPVDVTIPAGWTVLSLAYLDRTKTDSAAFINAAPYYMVSDEAAPMIPMYMEQPATFTGITALDDDLVSDGVNIVVDYNGEFDLDPMVMASWVDMFDDQDIIINATEYLDYSVVISQDGTDLETIDFTYDEVAESYTASAAVTVVDSSMFGAGYKATWMVTTPEGVEQSVEADIVIGVMPPTFSGVEDRFVNQNVMVDLLEGITADDGYGNDKTADIEVSYPEALNPYAPFPGEYTIDLEFTHNVFYAGFEDRSYTLGTTEFVSDLVINEVVSDFRPIVAVYTDVTNLKTSTFAWNTKAVVMEVAGDGTLIQSINRGVWASTLINSTNPAATPGDGSGIFNTWISGMTLEEGGFVLVVGEQAEGYAAAATVDFGDPVAFKDETVPDFDYDIITQVSYLLTIDDMTAPIAMVVNENYSIYAGQYSSINNAILANVIAYDFTDAQEDLVLFVSDNGGLNVSTPGTYTVEVTVEDEAGHTDVVTFDVMVMAALVTQADIDDAIEDAIANEIQDLIDANVLTEADVEALIEAGTLSETAIQALIDAALPEEVPDTGCGSAINGTSAIFITFSLVLGASAIFFFRRRR